MRPFFMSNYQKIIPRTVAGILVVLILLIPVFTRNVVLISTLIMTGIWAVAAMGFILVLRTGQFSLGQAAFMALGGYTSAILTAQFDFPFWPSFLVSGLVSGLIALPVGMVVLRVGGIYFSIITLALGEIVRIIALQWEPLTRGGRGIITTAPPPIVVMGHELVNFDATQAPYFYLMICLVTVTGIVFHRIGASRLGRMFAGVALNPVLAEHQGIHLMKYRVIAFTVAGVFTGYAGALYSHFLSIITPLVFGLLQSIQIMIFAIVGGISSFVAGPILGTILLYNLASYTARLETYGLSPFIFGAMVVIIVMFLPQRAGLIDLWKMFWDRIWQKKEPAPDAAGARQPGAQE
jgi:branched-chain amino acid transport system permease protein